MHNPGQRLVSSCTSRTRQPTWSAFSSLLHGFSSDHARGPVSGLLDLQQHCVGKDTSPQLASGIFWILMAASILQVPRQISTHQLSLSTACSQSDISASFFAGRPIPMQLTNLAYPCKWLDQATFLLISTRWLSMLLAKSSLREAVGDLFFSAGSCVRRPHLPGYK